MNPAPYRVLWKRSAADIQLATIVANLFERNESIEPVTSAITRLEQLLVIDPNNVGESRPDFERVATESPLTVRFAVHDEERLVYVWAVTHLLPRSQRG